MRRGTYVARSVCVFGAPVSAAKADEPIEMALTGRMADLPKNHALDGGARWRHMANTTECIVRGGDAVLCDKLP